MIRTDLKDLQGLTEFTAENVLPKMLKNAVTGEDEKESLSRAIMGDNSIKVLWIFDALDEAEAANDNAFRNFLQILARGEEMIWMKHVLLTSRPEKTTEIGNFSLFRLQDFQKEDVDTYIDLYFGRLCSQNDNTKIKLVKDVLGEDSEGVFRTPLLLQFVCFWIISIIGDDKQQLDKQLDLVTLYEEVSCDLDLRRYFERDIFETHVAERIKVKVFFLKCLEIIACQPGPFTAEVLYADTFEHPRNEKMEKHDILVLGLIAMYGMQKKYRFLHASFRDFFHACWWAKQPTDNVLQLFEGPELFEFKEGFYSALSLRFFCDLMARDNRELLLEIAGVVVDKQTARDTAKMKERAKRWSLLRSTWADPTREANFDNALCFRLIDFDLANLLGAVCDILVEGRHLAEGRALDHFVKGFMEIFLGCSQTPLTMAADLGTLSCLKVLLDHGANPDKEIDNLFGQRSTALEFAAFRGHERCMQVLLEKGARQVDKDKALCRGYNHLGVVKLLVENGANVNCGDEKSLLINVPLMVAIRGGNWNVVKFLLDHGAKDVNVALKEAAHYEKFDLIKKLLQETDANIRHVNENSRTALEWLDEEDYFPERDEDKKSCLLRERDEIRQLLRF